MLADDWTSLRDVQYRKVHLYDLDWAGNEDRQLDRCLVAVAKYGGAVAMVRDETKLLKVRLDHHVVSGIAFVSGE
ncbi:unnamed protein product, partial [Hapterophycus canaliculatus]